MDAVWSTGLCTMAFENRDRYTVISGLAVQGLGFRVLEDRVLLEHDMLLKDGDRHRVDAGWELLNRLGTLAGQGRVDAFVKYKHPRGAQKVFSVRELAADRMYP